MNKLIKKYIIAYESINISSLNILMECIDENFVFSDPFHNTKNKLQFKKLLNEMFKRISNPGFKVINVAQNKNIFFIKWRFSGFYKKEFSFEGMSEIEIKKNLIIKHIDYWDSGKNFYSHIPIIGSLFKKIHE